MQNRLKKYITFLVVLFTTLTSCEDFLDTEVEDALTQDENYETYLNAQAAVLGLYAQMQGVMPDQVILGELRADLVEVTPNANADLMAISDYQYTPNEYTAAADYYDIVLNANEALAGFDKLRDRDVTFANDFDFFMAEVTVIKVWAYFALLKNFQSPTLQESRLTTLETPSGSPVSVGALISMLEPVVESLNVNIAGWSGAQERFNYSSANALLGELYLYDNNYPSAIEALTTSILTGNFDRFILSGDFSRSDWVNIFDGENSAEVMSELIFSDGNNQNHQLQPLFSSTYEMRPTNISINIFDDIYRGEGASFIMNGSDPIVNKYSIGKNEFDNDAPIFLYRAADLHLMLAEAYNRIEAFEIALDLVNSGSDSLFSQLSGGVRGRVRASSISWADNLNTTLDSVEYLENEIVNERARELAYEGKRWYDLVRISRHRGAPDYLANKVKMKYPASDTTRIKQLLLDENNWYLPVN